MDYNLIYLAGLFDGEGSVGNFSNGKDVKIFTMEIKMTAEHIIDWLIKEFGGCKTTHISKKASHKDQWRWRVKGTKAEILYTELKPYLKLK